MQSIFHLEHTLLPLTHFNQKPTTMFRTLIFGWDIYQTKAEEKIIYKEEKEKKITKINEKGSRYDSL